MSLAVILIFNAVILIAILSVTNMFNKSSHTKDKKVQLLFGLIFGLCSIWLMNLTWGAETGVFYDARTILYAIIAVVFSPLTTLIAVVVGVIYRATQGGLGMWAGIITIVCTASLGVVMKVFIVEKVKNIKLYHYYIYGLVVHLFMLLYHFALPVDIDFILNRIALIAPVVLTIYPVAVVLGIHLVLENNKKIKNYENLVLSEERYRLLFDGVPEGILHFDLNGVILNCNSSFQEILGSSKEKIIGLNMMDLPDEGIRNVVSGVIDGNRGEYIGEYTAFTSGKQVYIDAQFDPLFDDERQVGGVGVVVDLTNKMKIEAEVERLSNTDVLTGLSNRKFYEESIFENKFSEMLPLEYMIISIDNFQFYLDTLGYEKAEVLLSNISKLITEFFSGVDHIYKISQNDFVVIAPRSKGIDLEQTMKEMLLSVKKLTEYTPLIALTYSCERIESENTNWKNISNSVRSKISLIRRFSRSSINVNSINLLMASLFEKSEREKHHSDRVSGISETLGKALELDKVDLNQLRTASVLHDIGKVNVESYILEKPGDLTVEEYMNIKNHTLIGYRILSSVEEYKDVATIVLSHHERWDGAGYPNGLREEEIPLASRIISIADSYDAMLNDRPYRKALTKEEAIQELIDCKGTQFDPKMVDTFVELFKVNEKKDPFLK